MQGLACTACPKKVASPFSPASLCFWGDLGAQEEVGARLSPLIGNEGEDRGEEACQQAALAPSPRAHRACVVGKDLIH